MLNLPASKSISNFFKHFSFSLRFGFTIASVIMILGIGGCSLKRFATQAAQVPQLILASPSDPATFNAPLNTSAYNVFGYINASLIDQNGLSAELEPALAQSWEISEDKLKITFTLREGLKWSDGEPLTADDVVFTFNDIYLNEKVPTGTRDILRIGDTGKFPTVRKLGPLQVEFTVPEPFAPFLRYAGGIAILPKHALQPSIENSDQDGDLKFLSTWTTETEPQKIVGAGMYTIEGYTPSQRIVFRRNPYYWRQDEQGNPQPYIERIVVQTVESTDNQLIAFRSGQLDALDVESGSFALLKQEEQRGKYNVSEGRPESTTRFFGFNLNQASNDQGKPFIDPIKARWFNNLAFRQAVAYAIDRQTMIDNIFRGLAQTQNSPIIPASPFFLPPEKGLKVYKYNREKAKNLLLDAGFTYNGDNQLLDWDGNRVKFTILVKSEEKVRVDSAVQIQKDLQKIGIQANLQVVSFNTVIQKLSSRNWESYVGAFGGGGVEPHSGFNIWYSGGFLHQFNQGPTPGEPTIQGWKVSDWEQEIDQLFQKGVQELDEKKRKQIYGRFQQIVQEQLPFIYLVNPLSFDAIRERVQNLKPSELSGSFWNLYELNVEQELY